MVMKNHCINVSIIAACLLVFVAVYPGMAVSGENEQDLQAGPVKLIKGARPISDEPAQRVFYISYEKNEKELQVIHARLVKAGARAISVIVPDAIVCELPLRVDPGEVLDGTSVISRVQSLGEISRAPALPGDLDWLRRAYDTMDSRLLKSSPEKQPAGVGSMDMGDLVEVSTASIERSAFLAQQRLDSPDATTAQDDPLPDQNSEFFAGNIHIQVVFVEVKDSDNWTTAEQNGVKTELEFVKMYYERHFRNVSADFTSRTFEVGIGWDPLTNGLNESADVPPLMQEIMSRMDPKYHGDESEYLDNVNKFNNDARAKYVNADWVFTIFVVDSSHKPDHSFDEAKKQMYAAYGGPFMVLAYPSPRSFEGFVKHGMTLIFWGLPEDLGGIPGICGDHAGYLNLPHLNKVSKEDPVYGPVDCDNEYPDGCTAMFRDMESGYTGVPCDYTMGHLGNVDLDSDNVPDIFDAAPNVIFWGSAIDTLFDLKDPVKLSVRSRPVINRNSWQTHALINYATEIERVSYTLNSAIGPLVVIPVDGIADELIEQYEIKVPFLLPGTSTIEVTAWNNFGAKSNPKAKKIFFVALDFWSFRFEHTNDGVGIAWYLRGETFNDPPDNPLELELHRSDLADSSDTIVAGPDVLIPIGPQSKGLTPYYFLDRTAAAGSRYRYYVSGKFDIEYRDSTLEITSNSAEYETVASLPREGGILSIPAPNPFQPSSGKEKLLMSVEIPGAEGIPLFSKSGGGINRVSAQQQTPEPIGLKVCVYDVAGREVAILFDEAVFSRVVNVEWDGKNKNGGLVASGMYFIKARASEVTDTRKVLVIR
jgi:hypothetical protein